MELFQNIKIGHNYDRKYLAKEWNYKSSDAIERGVNTPKGERYIILFVTKIKQKQQVQYHDYIDKDKLYWDGENGHRSDQRIINSTNNNDEIHLFYRDHHTFEFEYYGQIFISDYTINVNEPSRFIFHILSKENVNNEVCDDKLIEPISTEKSSIINSRIGQGTFREELIKLWKCCSVTSTKRFEILNASHIKPWRISNNSERLDKYNGLLLIPNLDRLFDKGLITFDENGLIKISKKLSIVDQKILGINNKMKLTKIHPSTRKYLQYHNLNIFCN